MLGRRSWRSMAAALGLSIGLAGCWPAVGAGPDRSSFNAIETAITPDTVGGLTVAWTDSFGGGIIGPGQGPRDPEPIGFVVATSGSAVVATNLHVVALDLSTGATRWTRDSAVLQYLEDSDGAVTAAQFGAGNTTTRYDDTTGAVLGTTPARVDAHRGALTLQNATVVDGSTFSVSNSFTVVNADDPSANWGGVYASGSTVPGYPLTLGARRVYAAGFGPLPGQSAQQNGLRAFVRDGGPCSPFACMAWGLPLPAAGTAPVLSPDESMVFTISNGTVYAVDAATGAVRWTGTGAAAAGSGDMPALADGLLYTPSGKVFAAGGCGATTCGPQFTLATSGGTPAVAGGLVWNAPGNSVAAYRADGCGAATCAAVWTSAPLSGAPTAGPIVSNGNVVVGTSDGTVVDYRLAPS